MEHTRRPDQRGDVHVMAAGMHDRLLDAARIGLACGRGVGQARALLQRQPVHVGTHQNGRPGAVAQDGDDAGAADSCGHLIAERPKLARHPRRRLGLAAGQLRIAMEMVEQGTEIFAIVARHGLAQRRLLRLCRYCNGRDRHQCENGFHRSLAGDEGPLRAQARPRQIGISATRGGLRGRFDSRDPIRLQCDARPRGSAARLDRLAGDDQHLSAFEGHC